MPEYLIEVHRTGVLRIEALDEAEARAKAADIAWAWVAWEDEDRVETRVVSSDA